MSFTTERFIEKCNGAGEAAAWGVDVGLVMATVLACLVAGAPPGGDHVLLLLFLLVT